MQVRVNQSLGMRDEDVCTVLEDVDAWLPRERGRERVVPVLVCLCAWVSAVQLRWWGQQ